MSYTYTSAADDAKTIRKRLKAELGLTSRDVSVRADNFSMGSAVRLRVKVAGCNLERIEEIARDVAERIRRCEISGDILSGGNRYVSVSLDGDLIRERVAEILPAVSAAIARADEDPGLVCEIGTDPGHAWPYPAAYVVRYSAHGYGVKIEGGRDRYPEAYDAQAAAQMLAHVVLTVREEVKS